MIKYIKIVRYCSGDSLKTQIKEIIDCGEMDKDTRLFFSKSQCITPEDLAELMDDFEVVKDFDFSTNNVVFKPKEFFLTRVERGCDV